MPRAAQLMNPSLEPLTGDRASQHPQPSRLMRRLGHFVVGNTINTLRQRIEEQAVIDRAKADIPQGNVVAEHNVHPKTPEPQQPERPQ